MLAEVFIGLDEGLEVGPDAGNGYLISLDAEKWMLLINNVLHKVQCAFWCTGLLLII